MKKTIIFIVMFVILLIVTLNLLDVITNKYIIASTYFVLAFLVAWAHYTSSKKKNTPHS
jgi:hypothetical protein